MDPGTLILSNSAFARIEWEVVNGVTGIVSATVAVISLAALFRVKKTAIPLRLDDRQMILHFLLFSSAWAVLVLAYQWIFEPFGPYLTTREQRSLCGIILSVPALLFAGFSFYRLANGKAGAPRQSDRKPSPLDPPR